MNLLEPQQLAVKYNPPKLCLIYSIKGESYYHDMPLSESEISLPSTKLLDLLSSKHPGYLTKIDPAQVLRLLDLMQTQRTSSKLDFRSKHLRSLIDNAKEKPQFQDFAASSGSSLELDF